jgi:hypothetical protein
MGAQVDDRPPGLSRVVIDKNRISVGLAPPRGGIDVSFKYCTALPQLRMQLQIAASSPQPISAPRFPKSKKCCRVHQIICIKRVEPFAQVPHSGHNNSYSSPLATSRSDGKVSAIRKDRDLCFYYRRTYCGDISQVA